MGRWQDLRKMLKEKRLGFLVEETMKGTHRFLVDYPPGKVEAGDQLPFMFKATWGHPRLESFFNPVSDDFLFAVLEGKVTAGGIVGEAPMKGTLELRYVKDATIRYAFDFKAQGRTFRYTGEKQNIRPWNLHTSHTICHGSITDLTHARELSSSVVRFDLKRLPRFLGSFRLG